LPNTLLSMIGLLLMFLPVLSKLDVSRGM